MKPNPSKSIDGFKSKQSTQSNWVGERPPIISPIRATFAHVVKIFEPLAKADFLDEETLTSSILGALTASFPLCAELYGTEPLGGVEQQDAQENDRAATQQPQKSFSWAQYKKSKTKDAASSEAQRGADFALVYWPEANTMRLALFQAKKGQAKKRKSKKGTASKVQPQGAQADDTVAASEVTWELDVHRRPKKKSGQAWREPQMIRLARTGHFFEQAKRCLVDGVISEDCLSQAEVITNSEKHAADLLSTTGLTWIHYLGFFNENCITIKLSQLEAQLTFEKNNIEEEISENKVCISKEIHPKYFLSTLTSCLADYRSDDWFEVDADLGLRLLPKLVDLMTVYIGDDGSGKGKDLTITNAKKVSCVTKTALSSNKSKINDYHKLIKTLANAASPGPTPKGG